MIHVNFIHFCVFYLRSLNNNFVFLGICLAHYHLTRQIMVTELLLLEFCSVMEYLFVISI